MQLSKGTKYTYADYLRWDGDERYELIDGVPYMMAPGPSPVRQETIMEIGRQLANFLHRKTCKIYPAPFDVRLNADADDDTVVQPDLSIICDPSKIDKRACNGAPDMIIEVHSPSTMRYDQLTKYHKYLQAGVREYWMVNPEARSVQVLQLRDGGYMLTPYGDTDKIPVGVLDGCVVDMAEVFPPEEAAQEISE